MLDPVTAARCAEDGLPANPLASYVQGRLGVMGDIDADAAVNSLLFFFNVCPNPKKQKDEDNQNQRNCTVFHPIAHLSCAIKSVSMFLKKGSTS